MFNRHRNSPPDGSVSKANRLIPVVDKLHGTLKLTAGSFTRQLQADGDLYKMNVPLYKFEHAKPDAVIVMRYRNAYTASAHTLAQPLATSQDGE